MWLTRLIRDLVWVLLGTVLLTVISAVLGWKWLFVAVACVVVAYVGYTAILGRQRLSNIPGRLVIGFVVLFVFGRLAGELAMWTLYGTKSGLLTDIIAPIGNTVSQLFLWDNSGRCPQQAEYYWARAALFIIALFGLIRVFRQKN